MPAMRAQKSGHIVLFSSLNGLFSIPFQGAYSATKHAVEAYGEAWAVLAAERSLLATSS